MALVLLLLGFRQRSFIFEFGGLAGMVLGMEGDSSNQRTAYSILSLGLAIPQSVEDPSDVGILFLQMAYYFYAVVTPIACLGCLILLFICPMTLLRQRLLLVAAEICNAWSAVEVFLLSICAALFQISTFASFIIGDKCDIVNTVMEDLSRQGIIPTGSTGFSTKCFDVQAFVDPSNCLFLVMGVLLNSFAVSIGLRIAHNAVDERLSSLGFISTAGDEGSTFAKRLCDKPIIGLFAFGRTERELHASVEEGSEQSPDEEQAEWRHWF